jgi:hypothetical protein
MYVYERASKKTSFTWRRRPSLRVAPSVECIDSGGLEAMLARLNSLASSLIRRIVKENTSSRSKNALFFRCLEVLETF